MSIVLIVHILAIAFWMGIVAVESVLELQNGKNHPEADFAIARYHFLIDRYVEIPTLLVILTTGFIMFDINQFSGLYAIKIVAALLAITANLVCIFPVMRRKAAADRGDHEEVAKISDFILRTIIGAPAALLALGIGVYWLMES